MKINLSERERKRSTGRLPRRPAESVPHRNTYARSGEVLSRRAFAEHFVARRARLLHTPLAALARRAGSATITPEITPDPTRAFDSTVRQRPARIRLFGAGKDRCFNGMRDFPRRSSRRARARRELRARGTRASARFARLRARASVDRASREVPRVSRRARAAQRGTAALTCRVRFDEHPKAPSAFEARQALVRFSSPFPREFPFRDLSDFPKGTRVKGNPKGNFWFHRGIKRSRRLGRRDRGSSTLAARAFRRSFS